MGLIIPPSEIFVDLSLWSVIFWMVLVYVQVVLFFFVCLLIFDCFLVISVEKLFVWVL